MVHENHERQFVKKHKELLWAPLKISFCMQSTSLSETVHS